MTSLPPKQSRSSTVKRGKNRNQKDSGDRMNVEYRHLPKHSHEHSKARSVVRPPLRQEKKHQGRPLTDSTFRLDADHLCDDDAGLVQYESEEELNRMRRLWKRFRRRMKAETEEAIENQQREDSALQLTLQTHELESAEPLLFVDCCLQENEEFQPSNPATNDKEIIVLNNDKYSLHPHNSSQRKNKSKNHSKASVKKEETNGFWQFFQMHKRNKKLSQKAAQQQHIDTDTVSTMETACTDDYSLQSHSSMQSWQSVVTEKRTNRRYHREILLNHYGAADDPWSAAHRGDLDALETRWKHRHDWTLEDEEGNTPLYYACQSGGAKNLRVVLFLLQQWPADRHIPGSLLNRCRLDAANGFILELLNNPSQAEWIIQEAEEAYSRGSSNDDVVNYIEGRYHNPRLVGIREEREDESYW